MIIKNKFYHTKTIERKANELLTAYYGFEPAKIKLPVAIDKILEINLNLNVLWENFKDDKILAALVPQEKMVALNEILTSDTGKGRENFTKAHEIGHWILHVDQTNSDANPLPGFSKPYEKICRSSLQDWDEKNADKFASYLLMPEELMRASMKNEKISNWEDIRKMAEKFGVSSTAMRIRLENLNFVYISEEGSFFKSKAEFVGQGTLM